MPKLIGVADSLENIPDAYHANYEKVGDKFQLKEIEFEDVAPYKTKLTAKQQKLDESLAKLGRYSKFAELGDDEVEELHGLRELKKQGKPLTVDEKAELERLHAKQIKKAQDDLAANGTALNAAQAELKHYKLTVPLQQIALKAGVLPDDVGLALLETQGRFRLNDAGKIVTLDAEGDETDITPETFFSKLYKEQRPKFYAASGAGGGGANNHGGNGSGGTAKTITRAALDQLSPNDRSAFFKGGGVVSG